VPSRRIERVNDLLRSELSELIGRTLKDPRVAGLVSLTEVETTADLRHAKVFVSVFGSEDDQKSTLTALRSAAGFLRREIAHRVTLRTVPELEFQLDKSLEHGDRILRLLKQVQTDPTC
jgi:ribosome-binding factor A